MNRSVLLVWLTLVVLTCCQDVEISDEDSFTNPQTASSDGLPVDEDNFYKGSPDVNAVLSFVDPSLGHSATIGTISLVAGRPSSFIVSLENSQNSSTSYSLYILEAALHYPRYFGYHIQNFTIQRLQNTLEPKQQASLHYTFVPAVQLAGQQFDLAVILTYHDQTGKPYFHSLFNETISFLEDTEGMDVELIFLGVMIVGIVVLALVFIWHWVSSRTMRRSHGGKSSIFSAANGERLNEYIAKKPANQFTSGNDHTNGKMKQRQSRK